MCSDGGQIEIVSVPYVFRYLVAELAAMNIRVELHTTTDCNFNTENVCSNFGYNLHANMHYVPLHLLAITYTHSQ